jgi:serine/threonine protein kinase
MVVGTVPYMSPEQIEAKQVDHRSDIFSLGIVLHEMATGDRPFAGASGPALMSAILRDNPPSVTEVKQELPRHLGRIIRHCLEKDPNHRFQTARDVHNELMQLQDEVRSGVDLATSSVPRPTGAPQRGRRSVLAIAPAVAVLALAAAVWLPFRSRQRVERVRALIPGIEQLASAGRFAAAYELAIEVERELPDDPVLSQWLPEISDTLTITTTPDGATA